MRKFLIFLTLATALGLLYVHERVILMTTGYRVEELRGAKDDLLDQHRVLHYNVLTLQSPVILNQRLASARVELTPAQNVEIVGGAPQSVFGAVAKPKAEPFSPFEWVKPIQRLAVRWLLGSRQAVAEPGVITF